MWLTKGHLKNYGKNNLKMEERIHILLFNNEKGITNEAKYMAYINIFDCCFLKNGLNCLNLWYVEVIISVFDTKLIQKINFCNQNNEKMIYETNFGHILKSWLYFGQNRRKNDFCDQNNEKTLCGTNFGHILKSWLYFGQKFDTK